MSPFGALKELIGRFCRSELVKVFSLSSVATLVKMLTGLISTKVVAVLIGPGGVALLGQLNNLVYIVQYLASGAINNGVVKYVSEHKGSVGKVRTLLTNALLVTVVCSLACGTAMIACHGRLSRWIMLSDEYGYIFIVFGVTVILYAFNMLLLSIVNGYREYKMFIRINVANSLTGLVFAVVLTLLYGLPGALIGATTYQSAVFFVTLYMVRRKPWARWSYFRGRIDRSIIRNYLKYALMTLVSIGTMPVAQILIRRYIMLDLSELEAGWWEAMNRISNIYLLVVTTSFSVYYLPRLSEITEPNEVRREIGKAFKVIIPLLLTGFVLVYLCRFLIIRILFTSEFLPMAKLFGWQMGSDLFKIGCYILTYVMIAKARTVVYVTTEIVFTIIYIGLACQLMQTSAGIIGVTQAGMAAYLLHMGVVYLYLRKIGYV
ncbi:O-antigen translocase [Alistipes indistinctus]|uniref:O-antigen translocase n=1 Tax=Alistipes indistinctus TaxID=626932 RepID=UPI0015F24355|nr:O-antigen translocase [Alistipes indistinctus]BCG53121.1 LPS biosynthesis protein [Alistipes indistinctus]